jgi:TRAP-type C4-dicarboxylate transport system permease large subunit
MGVAVTIYLVLAAGLSVVAFVYAELSPWAPKPKKHGTHLVLALLAGLLWPVILVGGLQVGVIWGVKRALAKGRVLVRRDSMKR